jgi:hypothetical protein
MAFLMAPAIHVFFSLVVGWHDYMPFPIYIPSLMEQSHRISRQEQLSSRHALTEIRTGVHTERR